MPVIYGDNPASIGKEFYDKIAFGGIEKDLSNYYFQKYGFRWYKTAKDSFWKGRR